MTTIQALDRAEELRIIISGSFGGESVPQVAHTWHSALKDGLQRRVTVDISALTGYDAGGRKLLRDMHHHGVVFAAATPTSLVFLSEISAPRRRAVTIMPEATPERVPPASVAQPAQKPIPIARGAARGRK